MADEGDTAPIHDEENEIKNDEEVDDLFGDDDDDEPELPALNSSKRQLDDAELDSGDDEGRDDRVADEAEEDDGADLRYEQQERLAMDMEVPRQAVPEPSDGEMYLMKVPDFMSIEPHAWQINSFQPPSANHHSRTASSTFSAYDTALSTVRWRRSPSRPESLQSNARINRWSDGSLTLQLASDPSVQYEIAGNGLAPPQLNPVKPTPTSIMSDPKTGKVNIAAHQKQMSKDGYTYLVVPVESAECLRVAHKITAGLVVKQTATAADTALEQLQAALASAKSATKVIGASGIIEPTLEDPEKGRRLAEEADRQANKERRKRDNALEKDRLRADRALGRSGLPSSRQHGLNIGMLEDEEADGGRRRMPGTKPRAKPRARRNSEYSSDEDFGARRFTREDDYDQEDDFLAPSDEEEVVEDDEEDEDDGIVEQARERTPKRTLSSQNENMGDDADADGEVEDEVQQTRTKRRRIVDEDEDE